MSAPRGPAPAAALAALAALALLLLAGAAAAATQDPATYPEGVRSVHNTPVEGGRDFEVAVAPDGAADSVTVTVCRFKTQAAPSPEVCYMNLGAQAGADGAWRASTSAVEHPAWRDGWVIGYKVTVARGGAELHAPDRLAPNGEPDYYRIVVGSDQDDPEPAPTGSAVVEDMEPPRPAEDAQPQDEQVPAPPRESAALPALGALALLGLAALARRR